MSRIYKLTVFKATGEKILDEAFTAENDNKAKDIGGNILAEKGFSGLTHRCTSPAGKLILFHR